MVPTDPAGAPSFQSVPAVDRWAPPQVIAEIPTRSIPPGGASRPPPPGEPAQIPSPDLARPDIAPRIEGQAPSARAEGAHPTMPQSQTALAPSSAAQIVRALQAEGGAPHSPIDIALDPPELGRVRLSMVEVNGHLSLSIAVERPETADLMRRHLVLLADEFLRAGVDAPAVQISHQGGQGAGGGHAPTPPPSGLHATGTDADDPPPPMPSRPRPSHGLDLRL